MGLQKKRILITAKAYPNPSRKYGETVCCAGIDLDARSWIRLYPIPFRDLEKDKKFQKYDIIEVRCEKSRRDRRTESYRVDSDSIRVVGHLGTNGNWRQRRDVVLPLCSPSFCEISCRLGKQQSLGLFRPSQVTFHWEPSGPVDQTRRERCYLQLSFFDNRKNAIEKIPYDFYYSFRCSGAPRCPGHKLLVIDWELGQAYRRWRWRREYRDPKMLLQKIKEKWFGELCAETKNTHFYVGNMQRFPQQFMVLGVFYPPR